MSHDNYMVELGYIKPKVEGVSAESLGLLSVDDAYRYAAHRRWVHPIIFHAAKSAGFFKARGVTNCQLKKRFAKEYLLLVSRVISGEIFVIPMHRTAKEPEIVFTNEEIERNKNVFTSIVGEIKPRLKEVFDK